MIAALTPLSIDSGIVLVFVVESDVYSDLLAPPSTRTACLVLAYEATHDVTVVVLNTASVIIGVMESKAEIFRVQQTRDLVMKVWSHAPLLA